MGNMRSLGYYYAYRVSFFLLPTVRAVCKVGPPALTRVRWWGVGWEVPAGRGEARRRRRFFLVDQKNSVNTLAADLYRKNARNKFFSKPLLKIAR